MHKMIVFVFLSQKNRPRYFVATFQLTISILWLAPGIRKPHCMKSSSEDSTAQSKHSCILGRGQCCPLQACSGRMWTSERHSIAPAHCHEISCMWLCGIFSLFFTSWSWIFLTTSLRQWMWSLRQRPLQYLSWKRCSNRVWQAASERASVQHRSCTETSIS